MRTSDINAGLKGIIEASNLLPAAHENGKGADRPYLIVAIEARNRADDSLEGGTFLTETGILGVSVVVDEGTYTQVATDHADTLEELFPSGLTIPITGGKIKITAPADIKPGFNAGAEYRVPVLIRYRADKQV